MKKDTLNTIHNTTSKKPFKINYITIGEDTYIKISDQDLQIVEKYPEDKTVLPTHPYAYERYVKLEEVGEATLANKPDLDNKHYVNGYNISLIVYHYIDGEMKVLTYIKYKNVKDGEVYGVDHYPLGNEEMNNASREIIKKHLKNCIEIFI